MENALRTAVLFGVGRIPTAGPFFSTMLGLLWPVASADPWPKIQQRVEELIDERLADDKKEDVKEKLAGIGELGKQLDLEAKSGAPDKVYVSYITLRDLIIAYMPEFQTPRYRLLLLPYYAQLVNIQLALLGDAVRNADKWGLDAAEVGVAVTDLRALITDASAYVEKVLAEERVNLSLRAARTLRPLPFLSIAFERTMALTVTDFAFYWPYLDPTKYPDATKVPRLEREIFSDPHGSPQTLDHFQLPHNDARPLSQVTIWSANYLDAVQIAHGDHVSPRMGSQTTGKVAWSGDISPDNPIVGFEVRSGDVVDALRLKFQDGTYTPWCGGGGGSLHAMEIDGHVLSSIHVAGASQFYSSADCVVFGFRLKDSYR
ncbi:MAG TPA: insecticidal delta-endotoxin Cry8Ea1 family protein [Candidatus Omnitrophota bacterium]|nr:insecticidal delta-endotoxin Cry8Ea1 family protein [Candidatus Omnitrophota bacterium]